MAMETNFRSFKMWKKLFTLVAAVIHFATAMEISGSGYTQVPNTFLSKFDVCTLGTFPLQAQSNFGSLGCLSKCRVTTNCSLACYNGSSCLLSSALVAPYWIPRASIAQSLLPFPGFACYSSWTFQNDLTSKIYSVSSSTPYTSEVQAKYAVDGHYCDTWDLSFEGNYIANNWFEINMGKAYSILKVVVKLRGTGPSKFFSNVRISVGNFTGQGNYASYTTLASFAGTPEHGQILAFQPAHPIVGRYIGLLDSAVEHFTIGEVKVIGYII